MAHQVVLEYAFISAKTLVTISVKANAKAVVMLDVKVAVMDVKDAMVVAVLVLDADSLVHLDVMVVSQIAKEDVDLGAVDATLVVHLGATVVQAVQVLVRLGAVDVQIVLVLVHLDAVDVKIHALVLAQAVQELIWEHFKDEKWNL